MMSVPPFAWGWAEPTNGSLIDAAEQAGSDVMITADQNLRLQQNLVNRRLAIIVLGSNRWPLLRGNLDAASAAVLRAKPGSMEDVPDAST